MDWQLAITRNKTALLAIVVALMVLLGLKKGGTLTTLPAHLYHKALLILRPAEAALRRLIIMLAYDLELRGFNLTPSGRGVSEADGEGKSDRFERKNEPNQSQYNRSFQLIEPLKTFDTDAPDFSSFGEFSSDANHNMRIPAAALGQRLLALHNALTTIEKQARRLARWQARRDAALRQNQPHRISPMRPGTPPGYQRRPKRELETILKECHGLARDTCERQESS